MVRFDGNGVGLARANQRRDREPGYASCKTSCKQDQTHIVKHELGA
jgi:hypothetical protein